MALNGNEIVQVLGQDGNGQPAAQFEPATTGQIAALYAANPSTFTPVGAAMSAKIGGKYLMNAANGSLLTLPPATGTGGSVTIVVSTTVTSNADKILAATTSDNFQGNIITGDSGAATVWNAALSNTYHSLQLNGSTTGGFQGDNYDFRDIGLNVWEVTGTSKSTGTAATPFSIADS